MASPTAAPYSNPNEQTKALDTTADPRCKKVTDCKKGCGRMIEQKLFSDHEG